MASNEWKGRFVIWGSFLLALIFQTIPWPGTLDLLRPSWILLVTCYWVMALPHRVNVGSALVMGLLWDLLLGFHSGDSWNDDVDSHLLGGYELFGDA